MTVKMALARAASLGVLVVATLSLSAPVAFAATFTVTTTANEAGECLPSDCTLREAVEAANAAGEGTIVVPAGEYSLSGFGEYERDSELSLEGDITIQGAGAGVVRISMDDECYCRVLYIDGNAVTISGVTIAHGYVRSARAEGEDPRPGAGGDILAESDGGTLKLEDDVIEEGQAIAGGGIFLYGAFSSLQIIDSTVRDNFGSGEDDAAPAGAGVYYDNLAGEAARLEGDTFIANEGEGGLGGAIDDSEGNMAITNSTFDGNQADVGGAIATEGDSLSGMLTLLNDTLAGDFAEAHGAELYDISGAPLEVVNTIVGPDGGETDSACWTDTEQTSEADIEGDDSCGFENGSLEAEPLLEVLSDNGGPTETRALEPSSPAIDAASGARCPATDQRGVSRPQGAGCDIGAYEYRKPPASEEPEQEEPEQRAPEEEPKQEPTPTPTSTPAQAVLPFKVVTPGKKKRCLSRRYITIHIQHVKRLHIVSAVVSIDGHHRRKLKGRHLRTPINLRGLPRGTFTVKIVARQRNGHKLHGKRVYHTCHTKLPGRAYLPL